MTGLQAPFPWFGGKSRVAPIVWRYFGEIVNYVEPFFGSGAVLLGRPGGAAGIETVNDKDGYVANFWRAVQEDPLQVAAHANYPVNENDLHARHVWLRAQRACLVPRLEANPEYYDAKIAGWWVWGLAQWIGGGFCGPSRTGPWGIKQDDEGVSQLVHLGGAGQGVSRRRVHLAELVVWFLALQERLRGVRVCCGDWRRILGPTPTIHRGLTGIFLDPPYGRATNRDPSIYAEDDLDVSVEVQRWAIAHQDEHELRIILCGYEGEHQMPKAWTCLPWKTSGGYANMGDGRGAEHSHRERLWCSPSCEEPMPLFR